MTSNKLSLPVVSLFSFAAAVLLTLPPLMSVVDKISQISTLDIFTLLLVVSGVILATLYAQFYLQSSDYSRSRVILLTIVFYCLITVTDILVRTLIGLLTDSPITFDTYIRDDTIRNALITAIAFFAVSYYLQIQVYQKDKLQLHTLENEHLQLQLSSLSQQLNPHFFFNSLNTLSDLIYTDVDKSDEFIGKLSTVFRYILLMQNHSMVALDREIDFLKTYFYLLSVRFENKIRLVSDIENAEEYEIPALSIQVLVENAVKHNRITEQLPLTVRVSVEGDYLSVCNNKNLIPIPSHKKGFGVGLKNLMNRCQLLTGKSVIIDDGEVTFCVKIPLFEREEEL